MGRKKWEQAPPVEGAVTEQFHEYLSPYGKNRNEFVVRTDNNLLTYIFSSANLDATRQRWVAQLASYNFALEYQNPSTATRRGACSPQDDAGCWSDMTEQQSLVQRCCAGEKERRITPLLHRF